MHCDKVNIYCNHMKQTKFQTAKQQIDENNIWTKQFVFPDNSLTWMDIIENSLTIQDFP